MLTKVFVNLCLKSLDVNLYDMLNYLDSDIVVEQKTGSDRTKSYTCDLVKVEH